MWESSPGKPSLPGVVGVHVLVFPSLLSSDRSQDSTAVALSDSSSTQDFFSEPTSLLEGSRKLFPEKRLSGLSAQAGPSGKDLPGPTEERGKKPALLIGPALITWGSPGSAETGKVPYLSGPLFALFVGFVQCQTPAVVRIK